jgi:threonine aldolase
MLGDPSQLSASQVAELRKSCTRFLHSDGRPTAAEYLAQIPLDTELDFYGIGGVVDELEREVAALLGKPAATFMPSGIMAHTVMPRASPVCSRRPGRSASWPCPR